MARKVDLVVVGGGAMGLATAWQAAVRGHDVVLLERFERGHLQGASHGSTRNFNIAYDDGEYVDLVARARSLWDELAAVSDAPLLDLVGVVNHGRSDMLGRMRELHAERGIESELLPPADAGARWTGLRFETEVLWVPDSGRIRAADTLATFERIATGLGAEVSWSTPVERIEVEGDDSARVVTADEEYVAPRVVVTAGAWTEGLVGGLARLPRLVVTQEQPAHFRVTDADAVWPGFNHRPDPDAAAEAWWYGPVYGMLTPGEGVKAGWHGTGPVTDPDARTFEPEARQFEALRRYAREWLPGVDAETADPISCTYTSTDTEDFVLDRVGPLVVGAGFSGHGFKFTPLIGEILVDLVEDGEAPARFRQLGRPAA
ncbi:FAD-dependent oxidoreductase [Frigoribacterium faeni]|uniref:N-methyl-L-tryptophan oxidase n=1 Tax=Frigoribacterium faeni TaxID=145483 RepID=A0A7W3PIV3_9MICO|nr:FAD-dependent oxidoreductase [Frigoribacterium faeni]MBA8813765.1 sarcosine oxidase [Frigoribacterium faeni]BFF15069.1 N-methyl-L-tryptophan oxidase [Microbacterium flavescens]GEK84332.1 N-methyl-L-tryptophan oxidase [Frigoribacterium faeni]